MLYGYFGLKRALLLKIHLISSSGGLDGPRNPCSAVPVPQPCPPPATTHGTSSWGPGDTVDSMWLAARCFWQLRVPDTVLPAARPAWPTFLEAARRRLPFPRSSRPRPPSSLTSRPVASRQCPYPRPAAISLSQRPPGPRSQKVERNPEDRGPCGGRCPVVGAALWGPGHLPQHLGPHLTEQTRTRDPTGTPEKTGPSLSTVH